MLYVVFTYLQRLSAWFFLLLSLKARNSFFKKVIFYYAMILCQFIFLVVNIILCIVHIVSNKTLFYNIPLQFSLNKYLNFSEFCLLLTSKPAQCHPKLLWKHLKCTKTTNIQNELVMSVPLLSCITVHTCV